MNNSEIIAGLCELGSKARKRFREGGDNEQFRREYAVLAAAAERLETLRTPCNLCRYDPPSSCDGKPCTICPADAVWNEEEY